MNDQTMTSWAGAVLRSQLPPTVKHILLTLGCHMTAEGDIHLRSLIEFAAETSRPQNVVLAALDTAREAGWFDTDLLDNTKPTRARFPNGQCV